MRTAFRPRATCASIHVRLLGDEYGDASSDLFARSAVLARQRGQLHERQMDRLPIIPARKT